MAVYVHQRTKPGTRLIEFLKEMTDTVRLSQFLLLAVVFLAIIAPLAYLAFRYPTAFILTALLAIAVVAFAAPAWLQAIRVENASPGEMPSRAEFEQSFERSVQWVLTNRDRLLATRKHYIWMWWFVHKAASYSGDARLLDLIDELKRQKYETGGGHRDFGHLLLEPGQKYDSFSPENFDIESLGGTAHYAPAIIYGLTGNKDLGATEYVQSQLDPNFADAESAKDNRSACLTHQVMGVHEIRSAGYCEDADDHEELMETLQKKMQQLLIDDPRAGDVYIQRVMMLVMTGALDQVKPVWLRRILDAQREDGGWLPYQIVSRLTPGFCLGVGRYFPRLKYNHTTFHTSSQGLLLMAMMIQEDLPD